MSALLSQWTGKSELYAVELPLIRESTNPFEPVPIICSIPCPSTVGCSCAYPVLVPMDVGPTSRLGNLDDLLDMPGL